MGTVLACLLAAFFLSPVSRRWSFVDLHVYREAGQAVLNGTHLYDVRFPGNLAFTYPPLSAVLFTILTLAPMSALEPIVTAASIALLPLLLLFALRLPPVSSWLTSRQARWLSISAAAGALLLEPMWTTLRYGQLNVLIAVLVLYDLSRPDGFRWKGVGIGLATGLKLTPGLFALYLLLTRRYRAAAVSLGTFAGTVVVGWAVLPREAAQFWSGAFLDPARPGRIENAINQSLRGAYARVLHTPDVQALYLGTALVVGAAGMVLAARAGRRGDEAAGFSLCAVTGLLVSPVSWSHHWVLAIPVLLLFGLRAYRRGSALALAGVGLATAIGYGQMIRWVPINDHGHAELHLDFIQQLLADAYVLIGLGVVAAATWSAMRRARARESGRDRSGRALLAETRVPDPVRRA